MNKFLAKLMAVILVGLVAVTGIVCLTGFTIGGFGYPVYEIEKVTENESE